MHRIAACLLTLLLISPTVFARTSVLPSVKALAWADTTGIMSNHCTVTSINEKRHLWLTAAHCVMDESMAMQASHEYFIDLHPALVLDIDPKDDLAIMITPEKGYPALALGREPQMGDAVTVVGHPLGWPDAIMWKGWVGRAETLFSFADKPYMVIDMVVAPGNSGSAVVDSRGRVISVVQIGWMGDGVFSPVCGGAPFSVMARFAGRYFER